MRDRIRADIAARALVTIGAWLPYWRFLTFSVIYVTDDVFTSDIFNGELPGRVLVADALRQGQWPLWTSQLCSGVSLPGAPLDPLGLAAFTLLPTAPALDALVLTLLFVAAHGAYSLARRLGADRTGAVLAGIAFAGSGYVACQLKHLAIVSTVVWLPVGLLLIDRVFDGAVRIARRVLWMAAFGLVFANQVLCGFPQSAYICGLVYAAFALYRALDGAHRLGRLRSAIGLTGVGLAAVCGAAAGAVVLLPLSAMAAVSDRSQPMGYEWATRLAYWPSNILTFVLPYVNGDVSDASYVGRSIFWEDYGYVGLATVLLAFYGGLKERRPRVEVFVGIMTLFAFVLVLGAATPVFKAFYYAVPGMQAFRFPTRFLIVVELGIAVLGGIGLTRLRLHLAKRASATSRMPRIVAMLICAGTALDLFVHQPRQNPIVPAKDWLVPPLAVDLILADSAQPRTFTPDRMRLHAEAFARARGWSDTTPFFQLRDVLEPNAGGAYWGVASADCYAGIAPRWYVDVWGDHNRQDSLIPPLAEHDFKAKTLDVEPMLSNVLRTFGVTHVLSPYPQPDRALTSLGQAGHSYVYRVEGSARARFVPDAHIVRDDQEAMARLSSAGFDPDRELLLHEVPDAQAGEIRQRSSAPVVRPGTAAVLRDEGRTLAVAVQAPVAGFLLLADTFYPGWTAVVDGASAPIYRANVSVRAVPVPMGRHEVVFTYDSPEFRYGRYVSTMAIALLLMVTTGALYADRRAARWRRSAIPPQMPTTT